MAQFNHCMSTKNMTQTNWNTCLYNSTDPYSLYASSARLSALGVSEEALQNYAHGFSAQSSSLYGGHLWDHRTNFLQPNFQGNGASGFLADYMKKETSKRQAFVGDTTSQTAFRMATDFSGLMAASDPVKCTRPTHPFYWRKRGNSVPAEGMTRTKDKYRVVYTEKQRIGLEKAFKDNKFITMKEKNVLSKELDLSERQIKIWFQNRHAKERRQRRKTEVEQDHVINEEQEHKSPESPNSDDVSNLLNASPEISHFSSPNYADEDSFEETVTKSQCRYEQNLAFVRGTSPVFYKGHGTTLSTSPTEWCQRGVSLTKCDVSPFAANPDWNSMCRS